MSENSKALSPSDILQRMSLALDDLSPDETIGYSNGVGWIEVATVEEIRRAEKAASSSQMDEAYAERNQLVAALSKLFPAGQKKTAIEGWDEAWHNCVYIDLPTGQVSWHIHDREMAQFEHLPPYVGEWDGHDTPEKYRRLSALNPSPAPAAREKP